MSQMQQILDMSCNMNKCKYVLLPQTTPDENTRYTSIFISIESIVKTWIELAESMKYEINPEELDPAEIASKLFEIVCHYKRYYGNKCKSTKIFTFLYYSFDTIKYEYLFGGDCKFVVNIRREYFDKLLPVLQEAMMLMESLCTYIPNIYLINSEHLPSSLIPYSIIAEIGNNCAMAGIKQRALIVSSNALDYFPLTFSASSSTEVYAFRRKHETIYTRENILNEYAFRKNAIKPNPDTLFGYAYPYILAGYPERFKLIEIFGYDVARKAAYMLCFGKDPFMKRLELMNETFLKDMQVTNALMTHLAYTDIPSIYTNYASVLQRNKILWKKDRIDYSIESVNESWFRSHRIDFASLFLGV